MILFPEVQEKAHAEIDSVVGKDRLPTFDDRDALPYIEAIICETLRWNPPIPLGWPSSRAVLSPPPHMSRTGIPHATTADDVYESFHIPKGTINIYFTVFSKGF